MDQVLIPLDGGDRTNGRGSPRSGILISAILVVGSQRRAARIRNLSRSGALVEARSPPDVGARVRLVRGSLEVGAEIIWHCGDRCGVRFDDPQDPSQWVPALAASGQIGVDNRIEAARNSLAAPPEASLADDLITRRIAEEVGLAGRRIALALDKLADFAPLVVRLPEPLQELEVLSQLLGHVQRLMESDDPIAVLDSLGMEELKRRLLRRASPMAT